MTVFNQATRFWSTSLVCGLLATVSLAISQVHGQGVTVDDFLPPSRGGATEVTKPAAVKDTGDVIAAATAQDAALAAAEANVKDLKKAPAPKADNAEAAADDAYPELGAHWVKFPSGAGVVATGMSVYNTMPNPNASRIAQRNSYVIAYTRAKQAMVQLLGETSSEGRTILTEISKSVDSDTVTTSAGSTSVEEEIRQAGNALLKGYVVFSSLEEKDPASKDVRMVFVTIASSPKTQKLTLRNGAMQSVEKLANGIQNVLDEVQQGVVPPVGGRVVTVPTTGESAIIGFGSALVRQGPTPAITARGRLTARTISGARARDALSGMINGDKTMWAVGVPSKVVSSYKSSIDFSRENDPNAGQGVDGNIKNFEQEFLSAEGVRDDVQSIRKGTLPPGIREKHWYSKDGHWSYTMVVYFPALSTKAAEFAKSMRNATLKAPVTTKPAKQNGGATTGGAGSKNLPGKRGNTDVDPLKGGVVSPRDDL